MANVLVRECTHEDLESILELNALWEAEGVSYGSFQETRKEFLAYLERFQKYFMVAESDGRIVGYVNGSARVNDKIPVLPMQETYLEVENIYVRPEFRDQHVGGDLIEQLLAIAEQNGIKRFFVSTVTKDTDRILNFYRSYGFRAWYVELFK